MRATVLWRREKNKKYVNYALRKGEEVKVLYGGVLSCPAAQ
jgi:hypothetical protein